MQQQDSKLYTRVSEDLLVADWVLNKAEANEYLDAHDFVSAYSDTYLFVG